MNLFSKFLVLVIIVCASILASAPIAVTVLVALVLLIALFGADITYALGGGPAYGTFVAGTEHLMGAYVEVPTNQSGVVLQGYVTSSRRPPADFENQETLFMIQDIVEVHSNGEEKTDGYEMGVLRRQSELMVLSDADYDEEE